MQFFDDSNSCDSKYDNANISSSVYNYALYETQYVRVYDKYIKPPLYTYDKNIMTSSSFDIFIGLNYND